MVFTHCGKLGDMFQCLPILSWWYKFSKNKPAIALAKFPYSNASEELLRMQECIGDVIHLDYRPDNFDLGGQPYKFDLRQYCNRPGPWVNLGFRAFPNKFYGEFVAEEHKLGYDYDFVLNFGEKRDDYRGKAVVIDKFECNILKKYNISGEYLSPNAPLLENLRLAMGADEVKTFHTASAILLLMAGKDVTVYGENITYTTIGSLEKVHMDLVYAKLPGKATWVNLQNC